MEPKSEFTMIEPAILNRVIGGVLNDVRLAADLTAEAAARMLGWTVSDLMNYESGHAAISVSDLIRFSIFCHYDLQAILAKIVLKGGFVTFKSLDSFDDPDFALQLNMTNQFAPRDYEGPPRPKKSKRLDG